MMALLTMLMFFFVPSHSEIITPPPIIEQNPPGITLETNIKLDEVSEVVEKKLPLWLSVWRKTIPDFSIAKFEKIKVEKISAQIEGSLDNTEEDKLYEILYVYSPDKTRYVEPHGNIGLFEENGKINAGFDPDSAVSLVDLKNKTYKRLLFCGPGCSFDDAIWMNNNVFAVVGEDEDYGDNGNGKNTCGADNNPCPHVATLSVFDLANNTVTFYHSSPVKKEWSSYLRFRFPQLNFDY